MDWKDIEDTADRLHKYFNAIYEPKRMDPGRQWPPKVSRVVRFAPSTYPSFSNILIHLNGAKLEPAAAVEHCSGYGRNRVSRGANVACLDARGIETGWETIGAAIKRAAARINTLIA